MTEKWVLLAAMVVFAFGALPVSAGESADQATESKMVIALVTDDFELAETDISHLGVGDAETILTESGKTVDLLRTEDGVEIYVDGELLDMGMDSEEGLHQEHAVIHKHVEVICATEDDCEETVWISDDEDIDVEALHGDGHQKKVIVIKEKIETN